jgi:hypothetical protein
MFRHTLGCDSEYSSLRCDRNIVELLLDYTESRPRREYTGQYIFDQVLSVTRAGPRILGIPGRLIIWRPLKPILFKLFRPMTGLACAEIADNFRGNSAAYENLILLAPHFELSQRLHSATLRWCPVLLTMARPLVRPCL